MHFPTRSHTDTDTHTHRHTQAKQRRHQVMYRDGNSHRAPGSALSAVNHVALTILTTTTIAVEISCFKITFPLSHTHTHMNTVCLRAFLITLWLNDMFLFLSLGISVWSVLVEPVKIQRTVIHFDRLRQSKGLHFLMN